MEDTDTPVVPPPVAPAEGPAPADGSKVDPRPAPVDPIPPAFAGAFDAAFMRPAGFVPPVIPPDVKPAGFTGVTKDEAAATTNKRVTAREGLAARQKAETTLELDADGNVPPFEQPEDHVGVYSASENEIVASFSALPFTIYPRCVTFLPRAAAEHILGGAVFIKSGVRRLLGIDAEVEKVAAKREIDAETLVTEHNAAIVKAAHAAPIPTS